MDLPSLEECRPPEWWLCADGPLARFVGTGAGRAMQIRGYGMARRSLFLLPKEGHLTGQPWVRMRMGRRVGLRGGRCQLRVYCPSTTCTTTVSAAWPWMLSKTVPTTLKEPASPKEWTKLPLALCEPKVSVVSLPPSP